MSEGVSYMNTDAGPDAARSDIAVEIQTVRRALRLLR